MFELQVKLELTLPELADISVEPVAIVLLTLALAANAVPPVLSVALLAKVALVPTLPVNVNVLVFYPAGGLTLLP
jgi:hypothetical protein